jgi:ribosome-binding factor A
MRKDSICTLGTICLVSQATVAFGFVQNRPGFVSTSSTSCPSSSWRTTGATSTTNLDMGKGSYGRSSSRRVKEEFRTKRQERVGHVVRTELARIVQRGPIRYTDFLEEDLRRTINIVNADVSPDLRQARITVSIMGKEAAQKRRVYAWLVDSTKQIRHKLAQELKHMKGIPNISFVLADVGSAVDVMNLIDRISVDGKFKRQEIGWDGSEFEGEKDGKNDVPSGMFGGLDFAEDGDEDDGWIEEDEEFLDDDDLEDEEVEEEGTDDQMNT